MIIERIEKYKKILEQINKQKSNCRLCNGTGKIIPENKNKIIENIKKSFRDENLQKTFINLLNLTKDYCSCQYYSGYRIDEVIKEITIMEKELKKIPLMFRIKIKYPVNLVKQLFSTGIKKILWIYGIPGSGKTTMLYNIMADININIYTKIYKKTTCIFNEKVLKENIEKKFSVFDVIGIDDAGRLKNFDYYDFFDYIYNSGKIFIITSNISLEEMIKQYSLNSLDYKRFYSRISSITVKYKTWDVDHRLEMVKKENEIFSKV